MSNTFTVGYMEKRSIHARNCICWSLSLVISLPKPIWISSLGSKQLTQGCHFDASNIGLRFLSISVQDLHFADIFNISLCVYGQSTYCPSVIMPQLLGGSDAWTRVQHLKLSWESLPVHQSRTFFNSAALLVRTARIPFYEQLNEVFLEHLFFGKFKVWSSRAFVGRPRRVYLWVRRGL